jgi:hypothetical protein
VPLRSVSVVLAPGPLVTEKAVSSAARGLADGGLPARACGLPELAGAAPPGISARAAAAPAVAAAAAVSAASLRRRRTRLLAKIVPHTLQTRQPADPLTAIRSDPSSVTVTNSPTTVERQRARLAGA